MYLLQNFSLILGLDAFVWLVRYIDQDHGKVGNQKGEQQMLDCYWNFSGPWRPREIKWSWDAIFSSSLNGVDGFKAEAFHCGEDRSDGLQPILTILLKVTPSHRWWSHRTQRRVRWNHQMSHHTAALQYQRKILFFYHICSPKIISCFSLNHHCVKGLCYISPCPTVKCPAKVKSIKVVRKRPVGEIGWRVGQGELKVFWAQDRTPAQNYQIFMGLGGGMASDGTRCFFLQNTTKAQNSITDLVFPTFYLRFSQMVFESLGAPRALRCRRSSGSLDSRGQPVVGEVWDSLRWGFVIFAFTGLLCFLILMNNRNQNYRFFIFSGCSYVPICSGLD